MKCTIRLNKMFLLLFFFYVSCCSTSYTIYIIHTKPYIIDGNVFFLQGLKSCFSLDRNEIFTELLEQQFCLPFLNGCERKGSISVFKLNMFHLRFFLKTKKRYKTYGGICVNHWKIRKLSWPIIVFFYESS